MPCCKGPIKNFHFLSFHRIVQTRATINRHSNKILFYIECPQSYANERRKILICCIPVVVQHTAVHRAIYSIVKSKHFRIVQLECNEERINNSRRCIKE